ncbi:MAG TPA: hypothetical protein VJ797_10340 [Burkholderiales bacterium]|nr:hypothetical protein [Burkholderiales bacterium]
MALERTFDIPIPVHDVQERWRQIQAHRRAQVRFSPIDENHTRVHVAEHEFDQVMGVLREVGLAGREAAGNPGALGVAPGGAGGTFPGGTGGTPGPGGGKPGTTP